jgi:hypothetical protein
MLGTDINHAFNPPNPISGDELHLQNMNNRPGQVRPFIRTARTPAAVASGDVAGSSPINASSPAKESAPVHGSPPIKDKQTIKPESNPVAEQEPGQIAKQESSQMVEQQTRPAAASLIAAAAVESHPAFSSEQETIDVDTTRIKESAPSSPAATSAAAAAAIDDIQPQGEKNKQEAIDVDAPWIKESVPPSPAAPFAAAAAAIDDIQPQGEKNKQEAIDVDAPWIKESVPPSPAAPFAAAAAAIDDIRPQGMVVEQEHAGEGTRPVEGEANQERVGDDVVMTDGAPLQSPASVAAGSFSPAAGSVSSAASNSNAPGDDGEVIALDISGRYQDGQPSLRRSSRVAKRRDVLPASEPSADSDTPLSVSTKRTRADRNQSPADGEQPKRKQPMRKAKKNRNKKQKR